MSHNLQFKAALSAASLHPLLLIVARVLQRSGYGDVQFLDRRHPRQKSRFGGHELVCELLQGMRSHRVVVKVVRDDVRIRNLDELAGTIIRMNADSGLVVSPGRVTRKATRLIESYGPIHLGVIDGDNLAEWLRIHDIGVLPSGEVDYGYFGALEEMSSRLLPFIEEGSYE